MGQVSYGTITITDTNDIERIYMVYAGSSSDTTAPDASNFNLWKTDITQVSGDYIWQRTVVKKSGIAITSSNFQEYYGDPVCITGPEGGAGAPGKGVKSVITYYLLSNVNTGTPAETNWDTTPQTYPDSGTKYYWTKTITTYTDNTTYESPAVYNVALTNSVKNARDANVTAGEAKNIAQQTSLDVTNLQTRTKYFWTNLTAHTNGTSGWTKPDYPVGTFAASGISGTTFDYENSSTYGYNTLYSNGIKLRYNSFNLGELTGSSLIFYNPSTSSQGGKAMELTGSVLKFYNPSNDSISMMDLTSSGLIFKTSAGTEIGKFGSDSSGGLLELSGRLNIKGGGRIGKDSDNYWEFGDNKSYNDEDSAYLIGRGTASIQLGETGHWRLDRNRIHTGWYQLTDSTAGTIHFDTGVDNGATYYWDYGMHYPNKVGSGNNKFLYVRRSSTTTTDTSLTTMKSRVDDDTWWAYKFYVDGNGNVHSPTYYIIKDDGTEQTLSGSGLVAGSLSCGTVGTLTHPVYFNNGVPALTTYQLNAAGAKNVITNIADNATSTDLPTTEAVVSYVTSRGYITTDINVTTDLADNGSTFYLAGPINTATSTGTLKVISDANIVVNSSGKATLHATTFDGTTFTGTAAKATNDADGNKISTTYLKLSGGAVSGEVEFGSAVSVNDEFYADSITAGNLIVNGVGRFTNGLYGDLTGNVTGSITGNAATADKVNHNLVIKLASGTTEGTNMFTFNGSVTKTVDITKSALGLGNVENKSSATIRGELTSANVTTALGFTPYDSTNPNGYTTNVGTITGVTAGTGLNGGGTSGTVTLNHSNSVTAQTTQGIYPIKIDAQGHISAYGSAPTTLSGYGITDAKIANGVITLGNNTITPLTSQWTANLYVGKTATDKANATATNGNVYLNLIENNAVRNAHKITGSGTTTVTSDADGNITISSADSKVGTVTSITLTQGTGISIGSSGTAITTSGSRTIGLADNYGDTKNPYASKTARYVLAAPANEAGVPTFRALTSADVGLNSAFTDVSATPGTGGQTTFTFTKAGGGTKQLEVIVTASTATSATNLVDSEGNACDSNGHVVTFSGGLPVDTGFTIGKSVPSSAVFTDTTYTFASGTNGFTVTPLNGTAQTITVTPSIANNITGSGTSGYLAKFNGANSITSGPALGTDTTKFLNNKGEWAVPTNTNTTYTLTNALASHKFTWTFTAGGSGSGSTITALELVQGSNITLTDDTTNKKVTIAAKDTTYNAGTGLSLTGTTFANTGVTGIKGNSESSYRTGQVNLTPANLGAVAKNDELLTTNPFRPPSMTGPYISKIDNAFYAANKRWNTSMTNISEASTSSLFDGSYETNVTIEAGKTSILTMDFSPTTYFPGYPYGYILVSFYYTGIPISVSGRVYCNYSSQGVGWHDISFSPISDSTSTGTTYRSSHQDYYNISQLEITIVGASSPTTKVTQVEMHLDRPDSSRTPFVSKYSAETLYYNLTAPKFIGDLQGKADSATKAGDATCILYPMANNEINFGGTAAKNTIYFGYRTIDNQASPTKYVFSGSTGTANLQCKSIYLGSGTSSYITATDYTGNASTATKWASAQTVYVTLGTASTTTTIQGGSSSAQTIGVNGTLAISNGGTGLTASPSMLTNLGSTTAANVLQASPRPGITGTLSAANGGTGQTSLINAANSLLNSLSTGSSTPGDNDYYISQYVGGGTTTTTYHRRPMSALWSYISGKISSSNTYVTLATAQTLTAAATKTYLGLQLYGSQGIGFGTTGTNNAVTQKANVKYDASLEAIVFSFS